MDDFAEFDIGPLTWVKGEIDLALERAGQFLQQHAALTADPDNRKALQEAQACVHQAQGALAVVGMDGITEFARALEHLLTALADGRLPWCDSHHDTAQDGLTALRQHLDALVDGKAPATLALWPVYRSLVAALGHRTARPGDLFFPDLSQRPPRREVEPEPLGEAALAARLKAARLGFERGLLKWLKADSTGLRDMRNAVTIIEATQESPATRAFWWVLLAFFDVLGSPDAGDALPTDLQRLFGRIDAQIRKLQQGSPTVAEGLMREVLYTVAVAPVDSDPITCVRAAYRLHDLLPPAETAPPTADRQALGAHLARLRADWTRFCEGQAAALPAFHAGCETLATLATPLQSPDALRLIAAIGAVTNWLRKNPLRHTDDSARTLDSALCLLESALALADLGGADFTPQVDALTGRCDALMRGEALPGPAQETLPADLLARRQRDRDVRKTVAQALQSGLALVEQTLDAYFRDPARRDALTGLEVPLSQLQEALLPLADEAPRALLDSCVRDIEAFAQPDALPNARQFEELAKKLSALGFYAEQLPHGPVDLAALLTPAVAASDALPSVEQELADTERMTRTMIIDLRQAPGNEILRQALRQNLETLRQDAELVADPTLAERAEAALAALSQETAADGGDVIDLTAAFEGSAAPARAAEAPRPAATSRAEVDAELLDIFLEEARDVLDTLTQYVPRLQAQPDDRELLIAVRRGFHTLKGSGRMVGLNTLGEAAWRTEQALNHWLREERPATPALLALLPWLQAFFAAWVERLAAGDLAETPLAPLEAQLAALKDPGALEPALPPAAPVTLPPASAPTPPSLPDAPGTPATPPATTLQTLFLDEARQHLIALDSADASLRVRAAHTLASSSSALGLTAITSLAHALEGAWERFTAMGLTPDSNEAKVIAEARIALGAMVSALSQGREPSPRDGLVAALASLPPPLPVVMDGETLDARTLPFFLEESEELVAAIGGNLKDWRERPDDNECTARLKRHLHTLKGSARMAGALALGERIHGLESRLAERPDGAPPARFLEDFETEFDAIVGMIGALAPAAALASLGTQKSLGTSAPEREGSEGLGGAVLRVRAERVDELVNAAGEIAIARARIDGELKGLKGALGELTENVARLRSQLREIEIQAESRIESRHAHHSRPDFDPLEMDRYTRFQELTRLMAESVDDVATVQQNLVKNLDQAEAALSSQGRLVRDLSHGLMGVRMVAFNALSDRLRRVVRQTARDLDKKATLDIQGGQIELDRAVLEQVVGPVEHLLRNAVAHGLELEETRTAAGKPPKGRIGIALAVDGNEVSLTLSDDGRGLDYARIRATAEARGLLAPGEAASETQLVQWLFLPGFTTATTVSAVAGRGVGLDVVKNEIAALGGHIEVHSTPGEGTRFVLRLPLTLGLTQAVLVRVGERTYAIPSVMVEQANDLKPDEVAKIRQEGMARWLDQRYQWHYLPRLLGEADAQPQPARRHWVLLLKGGTRRIALEVDALIGNQEVVMKPIGPQLARVPGIVGATVLGDGEIVLIMNPVSLAERSGALTPDAAPVAVGTGSAPGVLVVDDSLTVRKITGRLLERAGYRVVTARDGLDALEQMLEWVPDAMLVDIEMPRMDGFDLARAVRADARLGKVPMIMITSRSADKHRNLARELGIDHFLGKPYDEAELLGLLAGYCGRN